MTKARWLVVASAVASLALVALGRWLRYERRVADIERRGTTATTPVRPPTSWVDQQGQVVSRLSDGGTQVQTVDEVIDEAEAFIKKHRR